MSIIKLLDLSSQNEKKKKEKLRKNLAFKEEKKNKQKIILNV